MVMCKWLSTVQEVHGPGLGNKLMYWGWVQIYKLRIKKGLVVLKEIALPEQRSKGQIVCNKLCQVGLSRS